jgi:5-epi-alpha-selinene synthase
VQSEKIASQLREGRFTWLVGRFFPLAQDEELLLLSDFTSWLFWNDDVCDESGARDDPEQLGLVFARYLGLLQGTQRASRDAPFELALEDMRERFASSAPEPVWMLRFIAAMHDYFEACLWEAQNRRALRVPSMGRFAGMRRHAGGMDVYIQFVELVNRAPLPLVARAHRDVKRLVQLANDVTSFTNDLFSLDKELSTSDFHNLVTVLAIEERLPLRSAVARVVRLVNAAVHDFLATREKLLHFGPEVDRELFRYVDVLTSLMRGNLDWSRETQRYRDPNRVPNEVLSGLLERMRAPRGDAPISLELES